MTMQVQSRPYVPVADSFAPGDYVWVAGKPGPGLFRVVRKHAENRWWVVAKHSWYHLAHVAHDRDLLRIPVGEVMLGDFVFWNKQIWTVDELHHFGPQVVQSSHSRTATVPWSEIRPFLKK